MRVLVTGAGGLLGRALAASAPTFIELVAATRSQLDITMPGAVEHMLDHRKPDVIVNAAAYTGVDRAESEPERARGVNALAVQALGVAAARRRIRIVHLSTDYVFDGCGGAPYDIDAAPAPLGVYGHTKLEGEQALRASGARSLVVRTQWLYGDGPCFPLRMLERARAGLATRVVSDQRGRPTWAPSLAPALWRLAASDAEGVLHLTDSGEATWFDVAEAVFAHSGRRDLVSPCATSDFPTPARRPADSRLDTGAAERLLGGPLPHWRDSLAQFLAHAAAG